MAAFNFQPQHIVANPYTFFFKADTYRTSREAANHLPACAWRHRRRHLSQQRELKDTIREYDRLQPELDARLTAARAWEAEFESYSLQARTLGLLPDSPAPQQGWSLEKSTSSS